MNNPFYGWTYKGIPIIIDDMWFQDQSSIVIDLESYEYRVVENEPEMKALPEGEVNAET